MDLPTHLTTTISSVWGKKGNEWLDRFDEVLNQAVSRWRLADVRPFDNLSYHFVARAKQGDKSVVLKLGVPEPWMLSEVAALAAFEDGPSARLLESDPTQAAMLLEDLNPGTTLGEKWSEEGDEGQTVVLAKTMVGLWRPPPVGHHFESTQDLARALTVEGVAVPDEFKKLAIGKWEVLEQSSPSPMLLHGDLHHGNVLMSGDGYRAIDPMGIVGDPAFEVHALLHNPSCATQEQLLSLLEPRLTIVAGVTGLDLDRLRDWGFCGTVMSCCWDVEDGGEPSAKSLAIARELS